MTGRALDCLAVMRGIETQYVDAWGNPASIDESTKAKLLTVMGYDTSSDQALSGQIETKIQSEWLKPMEPVQVVRKGQNAVVTVRLPIELVNDQHQFLITLEDGTQFNQLFLPVDCEMLGAGVVDDSEYQAYAVPLKVDLVLG